MRTKPNLSNFFCCEHGFVLFGNQQDNYIIPSYFSVFRSDEFVFEFGNFSATSNLI